MQMQPQGLSGDEARALWERYRDACFIRPGLPLVWVWTGAHEFDLKVAGMFCKAISGAGLDLGTHAVSITLPHGNELELREWHIIPLVRLDGPSLEAANELSSADLHQHHEAILAAQRETQLAVVERMVHANLWSLPFDREGQAVH